jgi:tetraacyldisaccharide 4'-kinase
MNLHPVLRWILWPISIMYGAIARVRVWCYRCGLCRTKILMQPVISVGNLTVGGTGKTPMVIWLAERLLAGGKRVAILSRGHRPYRDSPQTVGRASDEVLLLRGRFNERVPVGVDPDRRKAAVGLTEERREHPFDCFVLDDGFQHLKLKRDLDIVLIDGTNPFGDGFLLPAGPLREHLSAISRASLIVITRSEHSLAIESMVRRHSSAPIFYAQTQLQAVVEMSRPLPGHRAVHFREHRYLAFCGIGNPQAFRDDLTRWGIRVLGNTFFRDHHRYTQDEADQLQKLGLTIGATALLCTEKDVFNLVGIDFTLLPVHFCRIDLHLSEEDKLCKIVSAAVTAPRPKDRK